jgi:hypothetical protein
VWGLALARALAESFPTSPTFELGPTALVTLATGLVGGGAAGWLARRKAFARHDGPGLSSTILPLFIVSVYLFWPGIVPHIGWTLLGGGLALTMLLVVRRARPLYAPTTNLPLKGLEIVFLACVVLALYLRTLGPTVGQADTFEFQVVAPTLGVAHPTGYPLYVLSGKLFSLLPFGSVAWRVNLTSAIFGTGAVLVLYQLISRLTRRPLVAVSAALAFAFSRIFWSQAVVAEVYTLHNLFVAGLMLLLLEGVSGNWRVSYSRREAVGGSGAQGAGATKRWTLNPLYALSLLLGLSFANHLTTALLLPAVALTILFVRPRLRQREWLIAVVLFLLGLALYAYIYLRWPMLHQGVWMSLDEFWRYVTGQQFGGALRLDAWRTDPTRYQIVGRLLREPFGWPGLILGAIGLVWLVVKSGRVALVTLLVFLTYVWYALNYYVPDVAVFMLPAHLVLATWIGVGMAALMELVIEGRDKGVERPGICASYSIAISFLWLLPLWLLWTNLPLVDQSGERDAYAWGERVLDLPLAPKSAILADSVRIAPLYYLQRIEGRRPDLDVLVLADESTYRAELGARLAAAQTVYLARFLPGLESLYHLRSVGPLTEVGVSQLMAPPSLDHVLGVRFSLAAAQEVATREQGSVELLGFTGPVPGPDGGTGLTLYWRADGPISEVYHVRLRLVDGQGRVWWQEDGQHAANNYYPTPAWHPGEVVADYHEIPPEALDSAVYPQAYTVQVGLFRPFSDAGLVAQNGAMWYPLVPLDLPIGRHEASPVHLLRARYAFPRGMMPQSLVAASSWDGSGEGLVLTGVDLPAVVATGAPVELRLYASASGRADAKAQGRPALTWTDGWGSSEQAIVLETWGPFRLLLQAPMASGDYDLRLGWVDQQGRFYTARCGWLAHPTQDCPVARVQVTAAAATALANFDGKMLLAGAEFDLPASSAGALPTLSPGQTMQLTLSWQGLQPMEENYTVSIQLVGPDGRLYGQTDTWPVLGTFPTSQWSPSQRFSDPYQVVLGPDAAPGHYQVGVVVYLLATRTRLPLLDAAGQSTGDIAWLGEFMVVPR